MCILYVHNQENIYLYRFLLEGGEERKTSNGADLMLIVVLLIIYRDALNSRRDEVQPWFVDGHQRLTWFVLFLFCFFVFLNLRRFTKQAIGRTNLRGKHVCCLHTCWLSASVALFIPFCVIDRHEYSPGDAKEEKLCKCNLWSSGLSHIFKCSWTQFSFQWMQLRYYKVPAIAFPHPPACGAVTPRCSSAFLHQQIMDGASAVHHLRKGFRLRRGLAMTFFSCYASFSSLSINNSFECPRAAREKKSVYAFTNLTAGCKYSAQRLLPHETLKTVLIEGISRKRVEKAIFRMAHVRAHTYTRTSANTWS